MKTVVVWLVVVLSSLGFAREAHDGGRAIEGSRGRAFAGNQSSYHPAPQSKVVNCSSSQYRYQECFVGFDVQNVSLQTQYSQASCNPGSSYGTLGQSIWVNDGCRADFYVTGKSYKPNYPSYPSYPTYPSYPSYPRWPVYPPRYPTWPSYPVAPILPPRWPQHPYPKYPTPVPWKFDTSNTGSSYPGTYNMSGYLYDGFRGNQSLGIKIW